MRRVDHGRAGRHLVELLDEHRAAALEIGDDVGVVDDLLADVDRCARAPRAPARRPRPLARRPRRKLAARRARPRAAPSAWAQSSDQRARAAERPVGAVAAACSVRSGRCSSWRWVSSTTRSVTSGSPPTAGASQADSMSTASAPERCSVRRRSRSTSRWLEAIGPRRTRRPPRLSTPSRIVVSSQIVVPVGPRSSVASTTSPGSRSGSSAPQKPAIRIASPAEPCTSWADWRRAWAPSRSSGRAPRARRRGPPRPRPTAARARPGPGFGILRGGRRGAHPDPRAISSPAGSGADPLAWTAPVARAVLRRKRGERLAGGGVAAADRALHRRRPPGVGPAARDHQPRQARCAGRRGAPARQGRPGTSRRARGSRRTSRSWPRARRAAAPASARS